ITHQCGQLSDLGTVEGHGNLGRFEATDLRSRGELPSRALGLVCRPAAAGGGLLASCHTCYGAQYARIGQSAASRPRLRPIDCKSMVNGLQVACGACSNLCRTGMGSRPRERPWAAQSCSDLQMDTTSSSLRAPAGSLPAQRIDSQGHPHVDFRAVLALALPLMANSAVQIILNLTDMWFVGHISTAALAAVGAVQWMILAVVLVLGGAGMAVQTLAAHAHGARRYRRAAQAAWTALWLTACVVPLFIALGAAGRSILAPFGFTPRVEDLAQEFWFPRVGGASFGVAAWAMIGFFNGIGRPRVSFLVAIATAIANAIFNYLFIFQLGWGVAGSAWASNVAQAVGFAIAFALFLRVPFRQSHKSHLAW